MTGTTKWLSTKQAADELGVTVRTVYRLIDEGKIPAYHLGRVIRLKAEDLPIFLEQNQVQEGSLKDLYPPLKSKDEA